MTLRSVQFFSCNRWAFLLRDVINRVEIDWHVFLLLAERQCIDDVHDHHECENFNENCHFYDVHLLIECKLWDFPLNTFLSVRSKYLPQTKLRFWVEVSLYTKWSAVKSAKRRNKTSLRYENRRNPQATTMTNNLKRRRTERQLELIVSVLTSLWCLSASEIEDSEITAMSFIKVCNVAARLTVLLLSVSWEDFHSGSWRHGKKATEAKENFGDIWTSLRQNFPKFQTFVSASLEAVRSIVELLLVTMVGPMLTRGRELCLLVTSNESKNLL